jgi:predicted metal-dependent TIM-barrel fold hydrolase
MTAGWVDSHAHLNTLTWRDLEAMRLAGVAGIVSPMHLDTARPLSPDTILDVWDSLLEVQLARAAEHLIQAHGMVSVNMGSTPREGLARLLELLPTYLARPGIVAIGEIGFEPASRSCPDLAAQEALLRRQLEIGKATGRPVVIHTPNPPERKRRFTEQALELCRQCGLDMARVAIDHCSEANIGLALEAGAHAAISVQPFRGMTPALACDLVAAHGTLRVMIDSDCSGLHSDPLAVPRTALALQRRGLSDGETAQVCRTNALAFYGID